jgi:hypothetical protein
MQTQKLSHEFSLKKIVSQRERDECICFFTFMHALTWPTLASPLDEKMRRGSFLGTLKNEKPQEPPLTNHADRY